MSTAPTNVQASTGTNTGEATVTMTVRYFAAASAAAGMDEQELTLPAPATIEDALQAVILDHGAELEQVLNRCSFLHNAIAVHHRTAALAPGDQLDVLPPFAGG